MNKVTVSILVKSSIILLISFLICTANTLAQNASNTLLKNKFAEYYLEYIDISKGLSNNYVSKIQQDDFGMMWFACEGGLNRYDGSTFKIIRPNDRYAGNLLNENIETTFIDSKGNIWVGTKSGGVSKYSQEADQFVNFNDIIRNGRDIPTIRITDIAEDNSGNIWIATWGLGLYKIDAVKNQMLESFLGNKIIQDIEVDDFGNVWSTSNNAIHKYDPSEGRLINLDMTFGVGMALHYDHKSESLLIGSTEGLFSFDIATYGIKELQQSVELGFERINAITVDNKGRIWTGSWSQGLYYSNADRNHFKKYSLIPDNQNNTNYEIVLDIQVDKSDQIWVGTGYGGVVKLSPRKSISYIANEFDNDINLPDNNIQSIIKDSNGALWCGTWAGGLGYSLDGLNFKTLPGTKGVKVSAFQELEDSMIVGTANGLSVYNKHDLRKRDLNKEYSKRKIKDIFYDSKQRLWVGSQQQGLFLYDYGNNQSLQKGVRFWSKSNKSGELNSERISKIVEDHQGNIWVGTYNGLYIFNPSDSTFIRKDQPQSGNFPSVIVLSLLTTEKGELWIGMPGGLIKTKVDDGDIEIQQVFNVDKGLKSDYITGVTMDKKGNIWISNTTGLATILEENDAVINLTLNQVNSYAMNINSYFNDGSYIYFGSSNGFFLFDPLQIDPLDTAPNLIFNNLKIDNKEVLVGDSINGRVVLEQAMPFAKEVKITHKESIVSVGFVPDDFRDQANLKYFYRVLGLQDNWIDNGNSTEISFVGLDAGSYTLEVKCTRDKVHFSAINSLEVKVTPPPWLSKWAYFIYLLILIIVSVFIIKFFVNRAKLKANLVMAKLATVKEHELNEAKLRFFTNMSHELRTPLTLILSPITEILSRSRLNPDIKERLNYVEKNAKRLLDLINQLIDFRKADQGELNLQAATGNFTKFAREIFLSFKGYSETQDVVYDFKTSSEDIPLTFDRDKMEIVLCNLLSNAFKFTSKKGKITISLSENDDHCIITVKDTGKGVSKEFQDKIFNRFFQIQDSESLKMVGSGIGLSLSHRIVQLHHGNIELKSRKGKGSQFIVKIPKGSQHFTEDQLVSSFRSSENIQTYGVTDDDYEIETFSDLSDETTMKLLIVDDNKDILSYLKKLFHEDGYQVETAGNGLEGKQKALETVPDLIISDVMMPEMDGIEMCKHLKNNIQTSHIPVILLTARTSTVHEVDGLETGADDYVRKPFDAKVIKSRVASQLQNRQKMRSYLVNKIRFESRPAIKPVNKEEKFINDLSKKVEESMHDEHFSIESLADVLCMSQSTLYRKIKSLTGMSIAGFIRSVRLKKATEILITEDIKLSAVAYSVGFNDYKYFKKSFSQQYGLTPREYRENAMNTADQAN